MATLEDRILGGKKDNYCSSSEDENEGEMITDEHVMASTASQSYAGKGKGPSKNTGPKGVLQDWQDWQDHEKRSRTDKEKQLVTLCKKTALTCLSEREEQLKSDAELEELFSEESLTDFMKERMELMMKRQSGVATFGQLFELTSADEFLKTVEDANSNLSVIIHIYERTPECDKMNEYLSEICRDYPYKKFCKIQASRVGVSSLFKSQGVPAILVYKGGNLIGNFVGLKEEFGSEFFTGDVENYLIENGILGDPSNVPKLLEQK